MNRIYVDTSAYLAVVLREPRHRYFSSAMHGAVLCSSTLFFMEAKRTLIRCARENRISAADFEQCQQRLVADTTRFFVLRELTFDLCREAPFPVVSMPRTLDWIHLTTAIWFKNTGGMNRFISADNEQLEVARELGLPT